MVKPLGNVWEKPYSNPRTPYSERCELKALYCACSCQYCLKAHIQLHLFRQLDRSDDERMFPVLNLVLRCEHGGFQEVKNQKQDAQLIPNQHYYYQNRGGDADQ